MRVLIPLAVLLHLVAAGNYVSYPAGVTYVSNQPSSGHLINGAPISYARPIAVAQPSYVYAVPAQAAYQGQNQRYVSPQQDIVYAENRGNNGVQQSRQGMHANAPQFTAEPTQRSQNGHYVRQYSSQKSANGQERQTARFTNNVSPYQYSTTVEHGPESYHHIVVSHSKSANYVQVNQTNNENEENQAQAQNPAVSYRGSQKYSGEGMPQQKLQHVVQVTKSSPEQHSVHVVQTPSKTSVHVTPAPEAAQSAAQYARTSNQRGNYARQGHHEVMPLRDPPTQQRQAQRYRSDEQSGRRSHYSAQQQNVQRVPQRYQNAAPAQQRSQKFQVRTPAIHNQFYDIEERVIVRPVGSALVEFPSQQLNAADCNTSGESQFGSGGEAPQPSLQGFDDVDRQPQPNYGNQFIQQQPQYFGGPVAPQYYPGQQPQFIFAHPPSQPVYITTTPQYPTTPSFGPTHPTASPHVFVTTPAPIPSSPAPGSFGGASNGEEEDTVVIDAKRRYGNRVYPKRKNCDDEEHVESKEGGGHSQYDESQGHEVTTTFRPTYMSVKPLAPKEHSYEGSMDSSSYGKSDDESNVVISITRKKVDEEVKGEEKPIHEKSGEEGKEGNGYVYESKHDGIDYNRKNKEHGYGNVDAKSEAGGSGYDGVEEKSGQDEGYFNQGQEGSFQGENKNFDGYDQQQGKSFGDDEERHAEPKSNGNDNGASISRDYLPAPASYDEPAPARDEFLHEPAATEGPQPQLGEYRNNQYARYNTQPQRPYVAQYKSTSRKTYSNPQYEERREVAYRANPQMEFSEERAEEDRKMQRFRQDPIYHRQRPLAQQQKQQPQEEQLPLVITRGSQSEQENAENQKNLFKLLTERDNIAQVGYERPGQRKAALMDAGILRGRVISVTPAPPNAHPTEERVNTRRIVISRPIETIHEDEAPESGDQRSYQNQKYSQKYVAQRPQRS